MTTSLSTLIITLNALNRDRVSTLVLTKESIRWFLLFPHIVNNMSLGILEDGTWVLEENNRLQIFDTPRAFVRMIVMLEQPIASIKVRLQNELEETLGDKDSNIDIEDVFPFIETIRAGIEQQSDYWTTLALDWLDELPNEMQTRVEFCLTAVIDSSWASQKTRQRVRKKLQYFNRVLRQ